MGTMTFKDLWSRKRRLVGMFTAVMVGVAFLAGTLVLGDTVRDSFGTLFTEANSGTAALVRSEHRTHRGRRDRAGRDPGVARVAVAGVDGVADTAPLGGRARAVDRRRRRPIGGNGPPTRGSNWVTAASLNPWKVVDGRAPRRPARW